MHQFTVISLRCGLFYYTYTWVPICRPWGYSTKLNPVSEEAVTHHTIQRYLQAVSFIKWNKDIAHNSQFFFIDLRRFLNNENIHLNSIKCLSLISHSCDWFETNAIMMHKAWNWNWIKTILMVKEMNFTMTTIILKYNKCRLLIKNH